jgi:8-amino-7-oxononanoate synthase
MLTRYREAVDALGARDRLRRLALPSGLDFSSNDYLGLASEPAIQTALIEALQEGVPIGAGGSRLLRGNCKQHEALEEAAARFFGAESALYFGSGYAANSALLATLPQQGDLVVHDALVHASAHEGMRAGRAEFLPARHNDAGAFAEVITGWRDKGHKGRVWIAVESLYSMDGDRAPLAELAELATEHDAFLIIDEAHATGVFGTEGRGLAEDYAGRENVICLHTCGKALGASGALVCAPAVIRDFLINRARNFIFSTAPSPLMAVAVCYALNLLRAEPERRERLHRLVRFANARFAELCRRPASGSQILPCIVGSDGAAMALAQAMQTRGYDIRGIRPPTVPDGTARLRIALTLNVNEEEIGAMLVALAEELGRLAP